MIITDHRLHLPLQQLCTYSYVELSILISFQLYCYVEDIMAFLALELILAHWQSCVPAAQSLLRQYDRVHPQHSIEESAKAYPCQDL